MKNNHDRKEEYESPVMEVVDLVNDLIITSPCEDFGDGCDEDFCDEDGIGCEFDGHTCYWENP